MKFFYTACICFALVASISAVAIGAGQLGNNWGSHGIGSVVVPLRAVPSRATADAVAGAHAAGLNRGSYGALAVQNYGIDGSDHVQAGYVSPIQAIGPYGPGAVRGSRVVVGSTGLGYGAGLGLGAGLGYGGGINYGVGLGKGAGWH